MFCAQMETGKQDLIWSKKTGQAHAIQYLKKKSLQILQPETFKESRTPQ